MGCACETSTTWNKILRALYHLLIENSKWPRHRSAGPTKEHNNNNQLTQNLNLSLQTRLTCISGKKKTYFGGLKVSPTWRHSLQTVTWIIKINVVNNYQCSTERYYSIYNRRWAVDSEQKHSILKFVIIGELLASYCIHWWNMWGNFNAFTVLKNHFVVSGFGSVSSLCLFSCAM